jgi:acyl-[acyl-carrier-protein] desaturase
MHQVSTGITPAPPTPADGIAYVALQELATRIAHRNTGKLLDDPVGYEIMARVASDENLHFLFYRDLVTAALAIDPSTTVIAIDCQVRGFEMPGTGIANFTDHAAAIANAGIYDLQLHHDQILEPVVLRHWDVANLERLSPVAEKARDSLRAYIERDRRVARRLAERRDRTLQTAAARTPALR